MTPLTLSKTSFDPPPSSHHVSTETEIFLQQIPDLLDKLSGATVHSGDSQNYQFIVAAGEPIFIAPLITSLQKSMKDCSLKEGIISRLKDEISLDDRIRLYELTSRIETLCKPHNILVEGEAGPCSLNTLLNRKMRQMCTFSKEKFDELQSQSVSLGRAEVYIPGTSAYYPTPAVVGHSCFIQYKINAYTVNQETFTAIIAEEKSRRKAQLAQLETALRTSSSALDAFPVGLLPLICSFLLPWQIKKHY